jgi:two-component system, sensor histidine kinase PdtaS
MERILAVLPERPQPVWIRYGVTTIIILLCSLMQYGMYQFAGFSGFFVILPGIFLCGFLFDRGSAFLATFIGLIFSAYLMPPLSGDVRQFVPLAVFAFVGALCAIVSEGVRKILERMEKEKMEKELLLSELSHRTKNNLMNLVSLLKMQARDARDQSASAALQDAASRVIVMADVHDYLGVSPTGHVVWMERYLQELCHKVGDAMRGARPVAIRVSAENIELPESTAVPIAIITNELLTNCFKYAFPEERGGTINVNLHSDGQVILEVADDGIGCSDRAKSGLGSRLTQLMTKQLGGTLSRDTGPNKGCRVVLRIPKSK